MKSQRILIISACLIVLFSCKKNSGSGISSAAVSDPGVPETIDLIRETAQVLESVYENDSACIEVNAAIYCGYYRDERVLLKDLLFPDDSELYGSNPFKSMQVDTGIFRRSFLDEVERGEFPLLKKLLARPFPKKIHSLNEVVSNDAKIIVPESPEDPLTGKNGLAIYFPYSENFSNVSSKLSPTSKMAIMNKPTIVATDRDADSSPGRSPYYCANGGTNLCFKDVIVNDDYANSKQTHIITTGAERAVLIATEIPPSKTVCRIYQGWTKLTRQLDKLVSLTGNGGGSEIKVCRINGYLKTKDQQVENFEGDQATLQFSRGDIRKKKWKRIYSVWDPNWNYQDTEQIYAVYEEDTKGEKTFSGALNTTVTIPGKNTAKGDISFKITVLTQDEIITQRKLDRTSFFRMAEMNHGWGFVKDATDFLPPNKDWAIYDGGSIWSFTMPFQLDQ